MSTICAIIPAYNAATFIAETLHSLLQQTRPPDEIIVVDDGSTDETAAIVTALSEQHSTVRLIQQANAKPNRARLKGLRHSESKYVYFLDADDLIADDTLERLLNGFAEHPNAAVCYGSYCLIDASGKPIHQPKSKAIYHGEVLYELLCYHFMCSVGSGLIRRNALIPETMDHAYVIGEDVIMWAQLAAAGTFYPIDGGPILKRRVHANNISGAPLSNPERYFEWLEWLLSYEPIMGSLSTTQRARVRQRRYTGANSLVARQALVKEQYSLARHHAMAAINYEPFNRRLWALLALACLRYVPTSLKPILAA